MGVLSEYLARSIGKAAGMTDREANAWAKKEEAERILKHEKGKVVWLCNQLELMDSDKSCEKLGRSASAWAGLADLYSGVKDAVAQKKVEQALEHEKAKVRWLCGQLERTNDGRHHDLEAGKTAEEWECAAELSFLHQKISPEA